jgi:drug/metabolite transporter (DMT)-like permease
MAFPVSLKGWIAILGTGVTFTFGYTLFFVGAAIIGATRAAMISILEPVLTILFAILLVQEWLTAIQWLGVALVVASLLVMEKPRKVR